MPRKPRRAYQRCTAICADGQRCGRWCKAGQLTCSAHDPNRKAVGVIAAQAEEEADPGVLYKRLMKDKDAQIRLRALNAFLDWEAKQKRGCKVCTARAAEDQLRDDLVDAMTDQERADVYAALGELRRVKERIYQRSPRLRPAGTLTPQEAPRGQETGSTEDVASPSGVAEAETTDALA